MGTRTVLVVGWLAAWGLACGVSGNGTTGDTAADGALDCLDGRAGGDQARLVITETEDSYHEMVVCGGLAAQLSRDLEQVLVTSFLDAQGVSVPTGFRYDGEGGYTSGGATSDMTVRYLFDRDYEAGAAGEVIVPNLFETDSYLRGVRLELQLPSGDVLVHWNTKGPLVELLGRGANPPNPLRFTVDQLESGTRLDDLSLAAEVEVVDARAQATVTYALGTRTMPVRALVDGDPLVFDLLSSRTLASDGSTLTATSPGVDYNDGPGTLTGEVSFQLRGGAAEADGAFVYADSSSAEVALSCR